MAYKLNHVDDDIYVSFVFLLRRPHGIPGPHQEAAAHGLILRNVAVQLCALRKPGANVVVRMKSKMKRIQNISKPCFWLYSWWFHCNFKEHVGRFQAWAQRTSMFQCSGEAGPPNRKMHAPRLGKEAGTGYSLFSSQAIQAIHVL